MKSTGPLKKYYPIPILNEYQDHGSLFFNLPFVVSRDEAFFPFIKSHITTESSEDENKTGIQSVKN